MSNRHLITRNTFLIVESRFQLSTGRVLLEIVDSFIGKPIRPTSPMDRIGVVTGVGGVVSQSFYDFGHSVHREVRISCLPIKSVVKPIISPSSVRHGHGDASKEQFR
ncbi:hypothetical protein Nepgr_007915 [Nepenthes gracilis]|uniref:Uncharacterized protein n=1 Tax=Nepenthes gracilis TaxID=150966 RepID=A0AAD3XIW7_NEPGR|nr:hypothetical protein Nepgr_007915 [Nepenthes gracilis]